MNLMTKEEVKQKILDLWENYYVFDHKQRAGPNPRNPNFLYFPVHRKKTKIIQNIQKYQRLYKKLGRTQKLS